jgi:hypothetical protein
MDRLRPNPFGEDRTLKTRARRFLAKIGQGRIVFVLFLLAVLVLVLVTGGGSGEGGGG